MSRNPPREREIRDIVEIGTKFSCRARSVEFGVSGAARGILGRVGRLERTRADEAAARGDGRVVDALERIMADDAGRDAVIAFQTYAARHHADRDSDAGRAAFLADPMAAALYENVLDQARRLDAVWWLPAGER